MELRMRGPLRKSKAEGRYARLDKFSMDARHQSPTTTVSALQPNFHDSPSIRDVNLLLVSPLLLKKLYRNSTTQYPHPLGFSRLQRENTPFMTFSPESRTRHIPGSTTTTLSAKHVAKSRERGASLP